MWWLHSFYSLTLNPCPLASLFSLLTLLCMLRCTLPPFLHHSPSPPQASAGSFVPLLPLLIGQPAVQSSGTTGSGVLGGLASKDW